MGSGPMNWGFAWLWERSGINCSFLVMRQSVWRLAVGLTVGVSSCCWIHDSRIPAESASIDRKDNGQTDLQGLLILKLEPQYKQLLEN